MLLFVREADNKSLKSNPFGFTLIELLVVIAIIAVLSVTSIVVYSGFQTKARDARRKADLGQIATAYEVNYSGGQYMALAGNQFSSGQIPKDPVTNQEYTCVKGPDGSCPIPHDQTSFQICATLEDGSSFCRQAAQGGASIAVASPLPTPPPISCPSSGLAAYWKMDEASGATVNDSQGIKHGTVFGGANVSLSPNSKIGNARNFDGSSGLISFGNIMASTLPVTLSLWVKPMQPVGIFDSANTTQNAFRNYPYGNVEWWPASPTVPLGLSSDIWAYLVFVARYDGGTGTRYVDYYKDGVLITTASSSGSSTLPWSNFNLGGINGGSAGWYWGLMDEVGIWSRALSLAEVATLYNNGAGLTCP